MGISDAQIARINELAKKKKQDGLNEEELAEQAVLRRAYIDSVKENFKAQVETTRFVDENGKDVTPKGLRKVQKEKGLR